MVYTLRFFPSSKCSLFHNSNVFGSCTIHILYTGCAEIKKKNNSVAKTLKWLQFITICIVAVALQWHCAPPWFTIHDTWNNENPFWKAVFTLPDLSIGQTLCSLQRIEYQEYFLGGKRDRCVVLTTLPHPCADRHEVWDPQPPVIVGEYPDLYRDCST